MIIVLLSGAIAAGKSSLASALVEDLGFAKLETGEYLQSRARMAGLDTDRTALQTLGDKLDLETEYRWVVDLLAYPLISARPEQTLWLLDSVRKRKQVEWFRNRFAKSIHHIHLTAPEDLLRSRYEERRLRGGEYAGAVSYDVAVAHANEVEARELSDFADLVIDTCVNGREATALVRREIEKSSVR